jgi:glycerol-3-phosphate acyltransferase PlsX
VQRAAIGALFPTAGHPVLVIDGGANVDCDARELVNFAHLGSVYARDVLKRDRPGVALLNVGEEDEKGSASVKEAHQLLKGTSGLHYLGNVEGRDILAGTCKAGRIDVVVCDGFVGNAILKFYESAGRMFAGMLKRAFPDVLGRPEAKQLLQFLDYSEYGGAPLLGIQGVAIICHGASPASAIKNAVRVAVQMVETDVNQDIGAEFAGGGAVA